MWLMNSQLSPKDQQGFAFSQATCPFYATFERRQSVVPSSRKSSLIPTDTAAHTGLYPFELLAFSAHECLINFPWALPAELMPSFVPLGL